MNRWTIAPALLVATSALADDRYQTRDGHPADHLPPYIHQVSGFGERPEWSHDSKRLLFVDKPMGEVYELDLATGLVHPKTRGFHHYGFTRAVYLSNGDILLSGPREPFDTADRNARDHARHECWLSVLPASGDRPPTPLNTRCAEGPAVSRTALNLAWTHRTGHAPDIAENHARLLFADLVYHDGVPRLENQRTVFDSTQLPYPLGRASLETQNLVPTHDDQLVFSVYQIQEGNNTDTYSVDLDTGEFRNLTRSPGHYDEPEGVFPCGKFTCVEHAPSNGRPWPLCDIYKLKLDGSGDMQRLTHFSEFKGYKGTQGVVSPDGRYLCFQIGKSGDEAGVGYGFFVMDLEAAAPHLGPFENFAAPPAFERIAFPMPERCDTALAVDTDNDGDLDLVGVCRTKVVEVRLPGRETRTLHRFPDGATIHATPWDADGDGDTDIALGRFQKGSGPSVAWLDNPTWKLHPVDTETDGVHGLATGDFDNDGRADLAAANISGAHPLSVTWYDADTKTRRFIQPADTGARPHYLAAGDIDGDGHTDLAHGTGDAFAWFAGPDWKRHPLAKMPGATNVRLADLDGDGHLDVVGACGHGTGIHWFKNATGPAIPVETELTDLHALGAGDLDGDGDTDLAAGSFGGYGPRKVTKRKLFCYENDGTGNFTLHPLDTDHAQESYALEIIDVDADGLNDILVGGRGSNNLVWYRNLSTDPR